MASRQEEKERRKQERLEREKAEAAAAQRKRLLQIGAGVAIAAAIVVGIIVLTSGGEDDKSKPGPNPTAAVPIPDRKITDLEDAAKAANCQLTNPPIEGSNHVTTKVRYKTNPPTSGDHVPPGEEAQQGLYAPGNEPGIGNWVHTLEHGRILFQYQPGTPPTVVAQLEKLFNENVADSGGAYHSVLMRNNTKMPFEVAAVAWRHYLGCEKSTPKAIDAMRLFREELVDTAPEQIP